MFIFSTTLDTARPVGINELDALGGALMHVRELCEEFERHLFSDEDRDAI